MSEAHTRGPTHLTQHAVRTEHWHLLALNLRPAGVVSNQRNDGNLRVELHESYQVTQCMLA